MSLTFRALITTAICLGVLFLLLEKKQESPLAVSSCEIEEMVNGLFREVAAFCPEPSEEKRVLLRQRCRDLIERHRNVMHPEALLHFSEIDSLLASEQLCGQRAGVTKALIKVLKTQSFSPSLHFAPPSLSYTGF